MNQGATGVPGVPYAVPREPGRWRAIVLAALVHAGLFAFLWIGIRWQNETPVAVEAEVWSMQPREAAPKPQPVEDQPPPPPAPPLPRQAVETPAPKVEQPDIALEQEKKRRQLQREQEQAEQARQDKLQKAAAEQRERQREQQRAQEQADAQARQKQAADLKKAAADKQRKQEAQQAKLLEQLRDADMRRIAGGAAVGSGGSGDAAKSQGGRADASYLQRVGAKIKSNTTFGGADGLSGNPTVEYAVDLLPDGSIRSVRKLKSSGVPGFDEAVLRAIEKSQPYPPDRSGAAPSGFTVSHRPKDQ